MKNMEKTQVSEEIWKIQKKIVKWYGKYGRKVSWIVIRFGNILKKCKLNSGKIWKIWKKSKLNSEKIGKIWKKLKLNSDKIWKIQKKIVKR